MDFSNVRVADGGDGGGGVAPLTWDTKTPLPSPSMYEDPTAQGTERTPMFDPSEFSGTSIPAAPDDGSGDDAPSFEDVGNTQVTTSAYELRPKFTGRSNTIAKLADIVERAFESRTLGFAHIIGEPGTGKSRLLGELVARMRTQFPSVTVLSGADDGNAYGPIARALAARFHLVAGEEIGESRDKIQAGVSEVVAASRVPEIAHLIAHMLRVPFDDSPVVAPLLEQPQRLEARMFMALKRLFAADAERRPLLVVVENLETSGAETVNLIQYLAAGLRDHQVALIATSTTALFDRHPGFGDGEVVPHRFDLGVLSPTEAEELLRELCKQLPEIPTALITHVRGLGGSPRAIHELVRLLLESDVIVRDGMMWRLEPAALAQTKLPNSYDEVVAARLRVMEPTERRILEMAAVIGETSWLDAILAVERAAQREMERAREESGLRKLADPDGPTLAQIAASGDHSRLAVVAAIGKLVEREWLVDIAVSSIPGERELRFSYANLWSIVDGAIDDARRRSYHGTVARWLELHPEGRGAAVQEEVARHLALGGEPREAAIRYRRAAEYARAQYSNERAIRLFDRALTCTATSDHAGDLATRIHLWHDLGSIYELIGDFEGALGAFERMLRLSWIFASKTKAAVAFNKMGRVWRRKGDLRLALEYLERGLELFRSAADQRGISSSLDDIGKSLQMLGRYDEAHAKITEALARRGKSGDKRSIATSLSRLGDVQADRGQYDAALACHQEALAIRKATGDRWGTAVSHNNLAALAFELGNFADARTGWLAALPEAEGIGALPLAALILTNLGELAIVENKLDEARSRLDNALEIVDDIEDRGLEAEVCRHLATLEKLHAQPVAAKQLAERAIAVAGKAGLREKEAQGYLTLGDVLSASLYDADTDQGDDGPASAAYDKAIAILKTIGNEAALGKALVAFGRFKAESGKIAEGKNMLRDALALFAKLGLTRPASEAETLITKLS